jgi:hypothetical protein
MLVIRRWNHAKSLDGQALFFDGMDADGEKIGF